MLFWIVAIALASAIGAALLGALARGAARTAPGAGDEVGIYRDQLTEVERDLKRGVIAQAEAERTRTEISRRLLDADRAAAAAPAETAGPTLFPALAIGAALMAAVGLYAWWLGAPGYPDLPTSERIARAEAFREARPSQAEAEAENTTRQAPTPDPAYGDLMRRLRLAVADNPGDLTGQRLLARNEAALGNYAAAAEAQKQVIAISGAKATAQDHAVLADLMVLAAGGYVSPEAESVLATTLALDPKNGTAQFYMGLMWAQTGRPDLAFGFWSALLEQGPEDAPWIPTIRERIGMIAAAAGVDYTPPAPKVAAAGPDTADMEAAAAMSDAERKEMIRGMVDRLSDRLESEGGSAEDWARLISSLGVLGETERARAAWEDARGRFEGHETETALLRAAAEEAGVAE